MYYKVHEACDVDINAIFPYLCYMVVHLNYIIWLSPFLL